jgi:hypothetical protein
VTTSKIRVRMSPEERAAHTREAAYAVAVEHGLSGWNRALIAEKASSSPAIVSHVLGPREEVLDLIIRTAVERGNIPLIVQAIGLGRLDPKTLPKKLRTDVAAFIGA